MITQVNARVVLKLPLDEITNEKVTDQSTNAYTSIIVGEVDIVPDDLFGSCLSLDTGASCIEMAEQFLLGDKSGAWALWFRPEQDGTLLDNGEVRFSYSQQIISCSIYVKNEWKLVGKQLVDKGKWSHLTLVRDHLQETNCLYINGEVVTGTAKVSGNLSSQADANLVIGADHNKASPFFNGLLAHVTHYDQILSEAEIKLIIEQSKTAQATFKTEFPLDFSLTDGEEQNVLYISNEGVKNQFTFGLENSADKMIKFSPLTGAEVSPENHHLQLKFKAKTFLANTSETPENCIHALNLAEDWQCVSTLHPDGRLSVYLLYVGNEIFSIPPRSSIPFEFTYTSADGTGGSRGSQVELTYQNVHYQNDTATISGTRLKHIDIVNMRGKKNVPLHVAIIGSNTILNDADAGTPQSGTVNSIKIRIANTLKEGDIGFNINNVNTELDTKFTVRFDDPVGDEWDLAAKDQLNAIAVTSAHHFFADDSVTSNELTPTSLTTHSINQGQINVFEIACNRNSLKPGEHIELEITNIYTNAPSGFSNIYLQYEDLPGYADGQFILQVEKSPIVHKEVNGQKNVGIGITPDEHNRLKINGDLNLIGYDNIMLKGTVIMWSGNPKRLAKGWVLCDGGYYDKYGKRYSSDGSGRVKVPNLLNRFVVGAGSSYQNGYTGGANSVRLSHYEMPSHNHNPYQDAHNHSISSVSTSSFGHKVITNIRYVRGASLGWSYNNNFPWSRYGTRYSSTSRPRVHEYSRGSNHYHENRPPYYALYYIIKTHDSSNSLPEFPQNIDCFSRNYVKVRNKINSYCSLHTIHDLRANYNYIPDGGSDMYDGGNRIQLDSNPAITYGPYNTIRKENNLEFFTSEKNQQLFLLGAKIKKSLKVTGNLGADGRGAYSTYNFILGDYKFYCKRVYGASDPSVNHLFIVNKDVAASHKYATHTDNDYDELILSNNSEPQSVFYFMWGGNRGHYYNNGQIKQIAEELMETLEL